MPKAEHLRLVAWAAKDPAARHGREPNSGAHLPLSGGQPQAASRTDRWLPLDLPRGRGGTFEDRLSAAAGERAGPCRQRSLATGQRRDFHDPLTGDNHINGRIARRPVIANPE